MSVGVCFTSNITLPHLLIGSRKRVRVGTVLFKCAECSYIAAAKKDVARHVRVLHRELAERIWGPKELFVCTICQKKFTRKDNAQKHYKAQHLP
jgi:uncharacterized C2H2 Zn-finger protein